jgi:hypothetical protein
MKRLAGLFLMLALLLGTGFFIQSPVSAQTVEDQLYEASEMALDVIYLVFGEPPEEIATSDDSPLQVVLFHYILPAIFLYFILNDLFMLMGMFTASTARVLAGVIALFAARLQVFVQLTLMINNIFGNLFISGLSFVFTMMILWWAIAHFFHGMQLAAAANKPYESIEDGMKGIFKVGDMIEKQRRKDYKE